MTLKLIRETDIWVLKLFAVYAMDGWTDGRMDKSSAYLPLPYGGGGIIIAAAATAADCCSRNSSTADDRLDYYVN